MAGEEGASSQERTSKPKVRVIAPIEGIERGTQVAPTRVSPPTSRMCAFHPNIPAVYICARCQKPLCINCGVPYGHLFICPQCHQPPQYVQPVQEEREFQKPSIESILGIFGGLLILVGFFMPWATSEYISPRLEDYRDSPITGFNVMSDYPELTLVLTMGALIIIVEFLLLILLTSPSMSKKPPIGIRVLPMFLGIIAYVVLIEVVIRAESLISSIHIGWFVCIIGVNVTVLRGAMEVLKYQKGDGD